MSERLIVEFYEAAERPMPVASVLCFHGGDDAESAAYTLAAFIGHVRQLAQPQFDNAGLLAARFISWRGYEDRNSEKIADFADVVLIPTLERPDYYLVAKVIANAERPKVQFLRDSALHDHELQAAAAVLGQAEWETATS